jgi:hypothetical protein
VLKTVRAQMVRETGATRLGTSRHCTLNVNSIFLLKSYRVQRGTMLGTQKHNNAGIAVHASNTESTTCVRYTTLHTEASECIRLTENMGQTRAASCSTSPVGTHGACPALRYHSGVRTVLMRLPLIGFKNTYLCELYICTCTCTCIFVND